METDVAEFASLPGLAALAVASLLLFPSPTHAEDCFALSSQAEMSDCVGRQMRADDGRLNSLYRQIQQRLTASPDTSKLFTGAQRAWVAYRDAECSFSASASKGGTIFPMVNTLCVDRLTESRIKDFEGYLHCQEGDTGCPVPAK